MTKPPLVDQPTALPTNKVLAGGIAGAIVTLAIFFAQRYDPAISVPGDVVAAATTFVSFGCAWFVRNRAVEPSPAPSGPAPGAQPIG